MKNFSYSKFENILVDGVLKFLSMWYLWVIPFCYLVIMSLIIEYKLPYYNFTELGLIVSLILLLLFAEISNQKKSLLYFNDKNEFALAYNVCINIILLFIVCFYLIFILKDFASSYHWFDISTNPYFGSSLFTDAARLLIISIFIINIIYSLSYTQYKKEITYDFYILLALAAGFLLLCIICRNLFLLIILIEAISITLVGLLCFSRKANSYEVSLKFFIISAIFGLIGMLGVLIIFTSCHSLDYRILSVLAGFYLIEGFPIFFTIEFYFLAFSSILLVSVLLFKLGLFPFHIYVADFASSSLYPFFFFF